MSEFWQSLKGVLAVYLSIKSFGNPLGQLVVNVIHNLKRGA